MLVPVLSGLEKLFNWETVVSSFAVVLFWLAGRKFAAAMPSAAGAWMWAFKVGRIFCYAASAAFGSDLIVKILSLLAEIYVGTCS